MLTTLCFLIHAYWVVDVTTKLGCCSITYYCPVKRPALFFWAVFSHVCGSPAPLQPIHTVTHPSSKCQRKSDQRNLTTLPCFLPHRLYLLKAVTPFTQQASCKNEQAFMRIHREMWPSYQMFLFLSFPHSPCLWRAPRIQRVSCWRGQATTPSPPWKSWVRWWMSMETALWRSWPLAGSNMAVSSSLMSSMWQAWTWIP